MKKFKFTINGNKYEVEILKFEGNNAEVSVNGTSYEVDIEREKASPRKIERQPVISGEGPQPKRTSPASSLNNITAPLPGVVFKLPVKVGDTVKKGDCVLILEAMKMENEIYSPLDGKISQVNVKEGQSVLEGDVLISIGG